MSVFQFKHFSVSQSNSSMKVGTDSMLLGALVEAENPGRILDIGAGTGVLSLMMAQKFPKAKIHGVEVDQNAVLDCSLNFEMSAWKDRLTIYGRDFLHFESIEKFDLIISNPPFFENSLKSSVQGRTVARHTDALPLNSLAEKVAELLSENGSFWVVLPLDATDKLTVLAGEYNLKPARVIEIAGKPGRYNRMVTQFVKNELTDVVHESITIRDEQGQYTSQYKELTECFHDRKL